MYKLYWSKMTGVIAPQVLLEEVGAEYETRTCARQLR
jgi:hypothetical protein